MNRTHSETTLAGRPVRGLCLSYHHTDPGTVGARRFRVLRELLKSHGIELDVLAKRGGTNPEDGVRTAGSFAPLSAVFTAVSDLKNLLPGRHSGEADIPTSVQQIEKLRAPENTARRGLRSLINSYDRMPDAMGGWILPATLAGRRSSTPYDFVISTAPPWSSHLVAVLIGRKLGIPVILDDRDPWYGSPARWILITHPWIRALDKRIAHWCYGRAAAVVCVTPSACELHEEALGGKVPIVCLRNAFDPSLDKLCRPAERSDKLRLTYVGSYYHGRSPNIVLQIARTLPEEVRRNIEFHFVGDLPEDEARRMNQLSSELSITTYGRRPHNECLELLLDSDVCLLLAIGQPRQIPAKVYEYIGLGRPILSLSKENDATMNLLAGRDWAWTVPSDQPESLRQSLLEIHRAWAARRLPAVISDDERASFSFEAVAGNYASLIKSVLSDRISPKKAPVNG